MEYTRQLSFIDLGSSAQRLGALGLQNVDAARTHGRTDMF